MDCLVIARASNPKLQIPSSTARPTHNCQTAVKFGRWRLGVRWDLELGTWDLAL